jgi:hypothetical protein
MSRLTDAPEYCTVADRLQELKADRDAINLAIAQTEAKMRARVNCVLPDRKLTDKLNDQRESLATLQRAISAQEQEVTRARAAASKGICDSVRPQHHDAQRQFALAVISANKSALAAAYIREQLETQDVTTSTLPIVHFPELGVLSLDPCSALAYFTRECLGRGLLERRDIPPQWLTHWGL